MPLQDIIYLSYPPNSSLWTSAIPADVHNSYQATTVLTTVYTIGHLGGKCQPQSLAVTYCWKRINLIKKEGKKKNDPHPGKCQVLLAQYGTVQTISVISSSCCM